MPVRVRSRKPVEQGRPQKPAGISLCMIVRNEERFLEQCLRSVEGLVDEICIVDTGSTDATLDIAARFGARIEHRQWRDDFGWARNESLAMATRRWILQLDADEELLPESRPEIERLKNADAGFTGVWTRCINRSDRYGAGQMSHALVRIFPNDARIRYWGRIHEYAALDGTAGGLEAQPSGIKILHHGYLSDVVAARDKYERNMAIIQEAIVAEPADAFHHYNFGVTAYIAGDAARAEQGFLRMWELTKDAPRGFVPNGLQILADTYNELKNEPQEGLKYAQLALQFSPRFANAHFSAGKALLLLKRYDESRTMYQAAIDDATYLDAQAVVDDDVCAWKAHSEIGASYALQERFEEAIAWYRRGLENRPHIPGLRSNLARSLESAEHFDEAETEFRRVYAEHGDDESVVNLVNYLLRRGLEADALAVVDASYERMGDGLALPLLHGAYAVCARAGHDSRAERYLRAALARAPGNAEFLVALEAILQARADHAGIARVREAEAQTPPEAAADFLRRSQLAIADRDFERALTLARAGIERYPDDGKLRYNAAVALVNRGEKAAALAELRMLGSADREAFVQGTYLLAVLLREAGECAQALAAADAALACDPDQIDAALLRCALLEQLERTADAEWAYVALLPRAHTRVAVELAGMYVRQGRLQEAKRIAEDALA